MYTPVMVGVFMYLLTIHLYLPTYLCHSVQHLDWSLAVLNSSRLVSKSTSSIMTLQSRDMKNRLDLITLPTDQNPQTKKARVQHYRRQSRVSARISGLTLSRTQEAYASSFLKALKDPNGAPTKPNSKKPKHPPAPTRSLSHNPAADS